VAQEFLDHGYEVRALDIKPVPDSLRGKVEMVYADLTDRLTLLKSADGCDKIAHLAAIPNPLRGEEQLMETNVVGTQYVLAAAEANGIKNVCLASSNCAFGLVFAKHQIEPQYLPMDENHPLFAAGYVWPVETVERGNRRRLSPALRHGNGVLAHHDGHALRRSPFALEAPLLAAGRWLALAGVVDLCRCARLRARLSSGRGKRQRRPSRGAVRGARCLYGA
jgi:hypothetical protein